MAQIEILAQKINHQLHVVVLNTDSEIIDLYIDSKDAFPVWESIYLGRVEKIDTVLNAAFVNLGGNQQGILPCKNVFSLTNTHNADSHKISEFLKPGDTMLVQVTAEGQQKTHAEYEKLARLTMNIHFTGRWFKYAPFKNSNIISRRLQNPVVKEFAQNLSSDHGWIMRTTADRANIEHLTTEKSALITDWQTIQKMQETRPDTPRLLNKGANAILRALIDYGNTDIKRVEIAEDCAPNWIREWCDLHYPDLHDKLSIIPIHKIDLFEMRDIHTFLEEASQPRIALAGGGSLIFEHTHAMTVIDVNRGTAKNIKALNLQAAVEVARQMRIRNISGAILVDFVSMRSRSDRYELITKLKEKTGEDPAHPHIYGFTRLGIMEITRSRRTAPLLEKYRDI